MNKKLHYCDDFVTYAKSCLINAFLYALLFGIFEMIIITVVSSLAELGNRTSFLLISGYVVLYGFTPISALLFIRAIILVVWYVIRVFAYPKVYRKVMSVVSLHRFAINRKERQEIINHTNAISISVDFIKVPFCKNFIERVSYD